MYNIYMKKTYKTLLKEIKNLSNWSNISCSWIESLNIVKMSVLPNSIYRFSEIPSTSQQVILEISKTGSKVYIWKGKKKT